MATLRLLAGAMIGAALTLTACGESATDKSAAAEKSAPEKAVAERLAILPRSETWTMTAANSGRTFQIFLATPEQAAPEAGYPVLYVMDGNAMFATAVDTARAFARRPVISKPAVVVGIGYPPGTDIGTARAYDLTPPVGPKTPEGFGGADDFLTFIEAQVKPEIEKRARIDKQQQILFGHSFGGLFTLHTLFNKPEAFQTYLAASPSIWWNDEFIYKPAERLKSKLAARQGSVRVLLTAGEYEQIPDPDVPETPPVPANSDAARIGGPQTPNRMPAPPADILAKRAQVSNAQKMQRLLAEVPGIAARVVVFDGEDHGTVIPAAISRGVRVALGPGMNPPSPAPAAPNLAGETPEPVPTAAAYMEMTPEGRYDLRLKVRGLPEDARKRWLAQLKFNLDAGLPYAAHLALHDERNAMDAKHGTKPVE
ncbi:MAG: alpha/beta hydrolase [Rhodospirillaceae bacterium]|nr:alpha/beta hydrolase [Rhodospirillaceae bacterium]